MLNIIICANFGVEILRGLENTRGQILEFAIEMAGHPYNNATLPRSLWWTCLFTVVKFLLNLWICIFLDLVVFDVDSSGSAHLNKT